MNPNHDPHTGEFSSGGGGDYRGKSMGHIISTFEQAHGRLDAYAHSAHKKDSPFERSLKSYKGVDKHVTAHPMSKDEVKQYMKDQRKAQLKELKRHMKADN